MKVRIALAALAGVATLAAVGVATAGSASASTTPTTTVSHVIPKPPPTCTPWQLSATLSPPSVQGHVYTYTLTLTNNSYKACTVSGPLGVTLYGKYGPMYTTVIRVPVKPVPAPFKGAYFPGLILLNHGQSATATISFKALGYWSPWKYMKPPFYGGITTGMLVTLPQGHGSFFFRIGPVKVYKNTVYVTALTGPPCPVWPFPGPIGMPR